VVVGREGETLSNKNLDSLSLKKILSYLSGDRKKVDTL
jgi:hypothetical protein